MDKENKETIKIVVISVIIVALIVGLKTVFFGSNIEEKILKEREYKTILNNLYFTDELIDYKETEDRENLIYNYKLLSIYLSSKYSDTIFYVDNYDIEGNELKVNLYQMINNVIIDNTMITLSIEDGKLEEYDGKTKFIKDEIDISNIISVEDVKNKAYELSPKIYGEIYLRYNKEDKLYYYVETRYGNYIKINSSNGEVIDSLINE